MRRFLTLTATAALAAGFVPAGTGHVMAEKDTFCTAANSAALSGTTVTGNVIVAPGAICTLGCGTVVKNDVIVMPAKPPGDPLGGALELRAATVRENIKAEGAEWIILAGADCASISAFEGDLVAFWPFDDTTADDQAPADSIDDDGTFEGGATTTTSNLAPIFSNVEVLDLSANSTASTGARVEVPDSAELNITGDITVGAWINPATLPQNTSTHLVFKGGNSPFNVQYLLAYDGTGNKARFLVADATGIPGTNFCEAVGATDITAGTWHLLVGTFDASTGDVKIYLDGVLDGSALGSPCGVIAGTLAGAEDLGIGSNANDADTRFQFNGLMDDVQIYDVVLTTDQIAALFEPSTRTGFHVSKNVDIKGTTGVPGTAPSGDLDFASNFICEGHIVENLHLEENVTTAASVPFVVGADLPPDPFKGPDDFRCGGPVAVDKNLQAYKNSDLAISDNNPDNTGLFVSVDPFEGGDIVGGIGEDLQVYDGGSDLIVENNDVAVSLQVIKNALGGGLVTVDDNVVGENLQVFDNGPPPDGPTTPDVTVSGNFVGEDLQVIKNADVEVIGNTSVPPDSGFVECKDNESPLVAAGNAFDLDECPLP